MPDSGGRPVKHELRDVDVSGQEWGSDVVADMLKGLGFEYASYNPGASFRGIEESVVNYNDNVPTTIEVGNEGLSVSIAHGYAKATGEPALALLHNGVGTLNGSMSIFNAYADRVPIVMLGGNGPLRKSGRRPWIDWVHSHLDQGSLVGDVVKWFDEPASSDGVPESIARGFRIASSARKGPVYITIDHDIQENTLDEPIELPDLSKVGPPSPMAPAPDAIEAAADALVAADQPVILVDQVGDSREAVSALVDLADALGAPVIDSSQKTRYNFPNTHPSYHETIHPFADADLLLALDVRSVDYFVQDVETATHGKTSRLDGDPALIEIGVQDVEASSHIADYYDLQEADVSILADTALAIPALVDAVEDRLDAAARERAAERADALAESHAAQREEWRAQAEAAWDETPIAVPRIAGELWDVAEGEEWVIVSGTLRGWPHRLWDIDEFDQYIGGSSGGAGVGYQIGAAIGGALAYKDSGRVPINFQADGDLMQFPSGLWTMAHYDLPLLTVVHNNGTLYNSTNHRIQLADHRGRDASFDRARIGTGIWEPTPDYAAAAEAFGVNGYGPVEDPADLGPALQAAWDDVANGSPALVDVIAQPR